MNHSDFSTAGRSDNTTRPRRAREIEREAADWIAARDSSAWNEGRQAQLDAWLALSTANRVAYLRLLNAWERADRLQVLRDQSYHLDASTSSSGIRNGKRVASLMHWFGNQSRWSLGAGALAASLFVATVGIQFIEPPAERGSLHATVRGQQAAVTLADGSRVTLNTDTKVRVEIGRQERRVKFDGGEAYFEVAHDRERPFVVEVGSQRVTVLGTKFSIRRDGDRVRVQVVEGRVKVTSASGATALLKAADTADATPTTLQLQHESAQAVKDRMGWLQGQLKLDGMTLEQAAREFNRYNQRQLRISDPQTGEIQIGGTFNVNNVEEFARLLRKGFALNVIERQDVIEVGPPT